MASSTNHHLAQKYQQKTDKQHILENPDTYIGSIETVDTNLWILPNDIGGGAATAAAADVASETASVSSTNVTTTTNATSGRIVLNHFEYIPGLYKLFDEGIVNCRDHVIRMIQLNESQPTVDHKLVSYIHTTVADDGTITFENDGNGIDVAIHPENKLWIPEMIFGHLRTSTNYDKTEKKIVGGKNGFGFKLVLIWSTWGKVETVDHIRGLHYTQEFHNNLDRIDPPVIKKVKTSKPYTRVTFRPDYARFGLVGGLTPEIIALFRKRVCDIAAVTDHSTKKIKVTFNGEVVPVKNFQQYIDMYIGKSSEGEGSRRVYEEANHRWEYAVALSPTHQFEQISFVNGICTSKGGKHVDYIVGQIVRKLAALIEKKKKIQVNANTIKEQLLLFLRCDIENPAFDSQTKDFMNTPSNKFGSTCQVSDAFIEKLAKMGVMDAACSLTELKERNVAAKKTDGTKTKTIRGIANFVDANFAGTPQSKDCVLILCEGLSAMTGVVSGLTSEDRNYYGIYPLKGKLLNVRGEAVKKITENKEITDLKKILGLESGKEYANMDDVHRNLRYGKIVTLTDQDLDGSHIKGLCINLFQSEWASLFRIHGFLSFMNTPILRATRKNPNQTMVFYNEGEYQKWKDEFPNSIPPKAWTIKYFKGLGTSTASEFKEYFANKRIIDFHYRGEASDEIVDRIFNKKRADERKTWLENYDKNSYLDTTKTEVQYEDFINKELIHFSVYDCERSIPNMVDGFKTSLRKIMYSAFKRNLTSEVKVAQFSGYVSEHSEYHHGEQSLNKTIVGLAQNFVGSNNINWLVPQGQHGCLSPETPILMWDGFMKLAKDVKVDDKLVGDDGQPRTVLKTTNGIDDMYKIILANDKTFTVNTEHILTLFYTKNFKIYWKPHENMWTMYYFDGSNIQQKCVKVSDKLNLSKEEAYDKILQFKEDIIKQNANISSSNIIDVKLTDYLKFSKTNKKNIFMVNNISNIQWEKKEVPIDPYIFGAWLGDGDHCGSGFTTIDDEIVKSFALSLDKINAEVTHKSNKNRNDYYRYGIRRKNSGKGATIGDVSNSSITCVACQQSKIKLSSCDWVFEKSPKQEIISNNSRGDVRKDLNPFREILKKYNLFKNKHIPDLYMINDEETRLQLLAGFIDTDGYIQNNNTSTPSIIISQSNRDHGCLIDSLNFIAQSLGFATSVKYLYTGKLTKINKKDATKKVLRIFGNNLSRIPTKVFRKKIIQKSERIHHEMHYTPFKIEEIGKGEYYGWSIDGNERFLLGDFTVTHNSRLHGGDDAASERYIFTYLNPLTRYVFPEKDDPILNYLNEDGTQIEPEYYVPILPTVLLNGISGIGTGFSSSIPPFSPKDVVQYIRGQLRGEYEDIEFRPYFENFRGSVSKIEGEPNKFMIRGCYEKIAEDRIRITELPVGTWTMPYVTFLEGLVDGQVDKNGKKLPAQIRDFVSNSTEKVVDIQVVFAKGRIAELEAQEPVPGVNGLEKLLKLTTTVSTTNMNLFDADCKLHKYATVEEIIDAFIQVRYATYQKRKNYLIREMERVMLKLSNKAKYIQANLDGTVDLRRKSHEQIHTMLTSMGFALLDDGGYDYLIKMPMVSVSKENVERLMRECAETAAELEQLRKTTVEQMWLGELERFMEQYELYVNKRAAEYTVAVASGNTSSGSKTKAKKIGKK